MTESRKRKWLVPATLLAMLLPAAPLMAQDGQSANGLVDWPMRTDPVVEVPAAPTAFHPRLSAMWMQALSQPDSLTRYQAALAIEAAHAQGMPSLEMTLNRLAIMVAAADEHVMARQAAARAIVAMDAKDHAQALWDASQDLGRDMMFITAPALARWQHGPAIESWRKLVADNQASPALRRMAIEALAQAKDAASRPALHALAMQSDATPDLRLAAARAYVQVVGSDAGQLPALPAASRDVGSIDNVVRVHLLRAHASEAAYRQLLPLLDHADASIATIAGQALLANAPARLDPALAKLSQSGDAGLRKLAIERWIGQAQPTAVTGLAKLLGDEQPELRELAASGLMQLSKNPALASPVSDALLQALKSDHPLVLEQASLAAGELKVAAAADRLVQLLGHESQAIGLAAATSLRKIQVADTLAPALANVQKLLEKDAPQVRDEQAAQLIQLFGLMKYQPANETLRKLVPKNAGPSLSRHAAVWSLGHLHDGTPDTGLASQLLGRINDTQGMEPEDDQVRFQSVIALGRMKATSQVSALQRLASGPDATTHLGAAARWSLGQITGTQPPEPSPPPVVYIGGGFLEPTN